jgi:hypothetical protein
MLQLGFVEAILADREREIAELIRQRRLLKPEPEAESAKATEAPATDPHRARARVRAIGG